MVWRSWLYQETTPGPLSPASVRRAAQRISSRPRKRSSPASSSPVCWRAAARISPGLERARRCHLGHGGAQVGRSRGEPGRGQVVEDDGGRTAHRSAGSDAVVTRTTGRAGVSSGRNQRNQIRPRSCPAVEIQLGWPGSWGATTMRQEPSAS